MIGPAGFMQAPNTDESRKVQDDKPTTMREACAQAAQRMGIPAFDVSMCDGSDYDCPDCPWHGIE